MTCHAGHAESFSKTLMGKIGKTQPGKFACENCHGPGSVHVKLGGGRGVGGIISFRVEDLSRTPEENNAVCLTCHEKGNRTLWQGSTHEQRGLSCTNCHTVMKNVSRKFQLKTEFQPDTCYQCHQNKRAQMYRTSHMPVVESGAVDTAARVGKMVCTSCHNPHGSYSESLLKKATVNEVCFQCHAEKRGPFLWEHPPVTENCLNCHDPHGSNNDFLLKISRPRLCQQCHSGGQHNSNPRNPAVTLYAQGRECQNCHSNHHGSNNPAGARFMR
jgi:DmsE family decaheme c-type cytochrome